jgi:RimJ/RimL family protein N-acetyltransferase
MEDHRQILLNTPRLILRLPNENDAVQLQAFDERNRGHMSPWRSTTKEPQKDHKAQLIQWIEEFKEGKSVRFLYF